MTRRSALLPAMLGGLVILVAGLAFFHTYRISSSCGADFLWNSDEAYLFLGCGRLGYRLSYLEYPIEVVRERLGVVRQVDDRRFSTIVLRITPAAVQTYTADGLSFDFYTPFEGAVFANHEGTLWKWSGTRFEQATPEDQRRFDGTHRLSAFDVSKVDGWSKRSAVFSQLGDEVKIPIEIGGKVLTLVVTRRDTSRNIDVTIARPGRDSQEIWHLDQHPQRVSGVEYHQLFRQP